MASEQLATLLVGCPDRKGIVAALAQVLYGHGANILDSDQHSDPVAQMFFQRLRFDMSTLNTDRVSLEQGIREVAERFKMDWRLAYGHQQKKVAIWVSKLEHCLYDLLVRYRAGELPCDVAMILSNHPDAAKVASHFDVPFHHIPVTAETKAAAEAKAVELMTEGKIDLIVLARYMQILSPDLVAKYPARIINIHHSFLPAFVGANRNRLTEISASTLAAIRKRPRSCSRTPALDLPDATAPPLRALASRRLSLFSRDPRRYRGAYTARWTARSRDLGLARS